MSKQMFDEIENIDVRVLAREVDRNKTWSSSDPVYRKLVPYLSPEGHFQAWQLYRQFDSQKHKQMKLKAELTRYMKKMNRLPYNSEAESHLQTIVTSIVNDLVAIQDEFTYWQKEVEKWLTASNT